MDNRNSGAMMGVGLVAGLALGLAIGLLYAPQPGSETRAMLRERAMELKEKGGEIAEDMKEKAGEVMQTARERMHVGGDSHM